MLLALSTSIILMCLICLTYIIPIVYLNYDRNIRNWSKDQLWFIFSIGYLSIFLILFSIVFMVSLKEYEPKGIDFYIRAANQAEDVAEKMR